MFYIISQLGEGFKQYRNQHLFAFFAVGLFPSYSNHYLIGCIHRFNVCTKNI